MNKDQMLSLLRSLLKIGGAALAAHGMSKAASWLNAEDVIGAVLTLAGVLFSHSTHSEDTGGNQAGLGKLASLVLVLGIGAGVVTFPTGCTTSQQQKAYNTLYSLETTTTAAYDSYVALVIAGTVPTNDVPRVSKAYNVFQGGFLVALDAAQYNTNALAPAALVTESQDVVNLIGRIKGK